MRAEREGDYNIYMEFWRGRGRVWFYMGLVEKKSGRGIWVRLVCREIWKFALYSHSLSFLLLIGVLQAAKVSLHRRIGFARCTRLGFSLGL